ncbi:MAG: hypothetical protein QXT91_00550 [Candidatus Caldarchaeum sp.]
MPTYTIFPSLVVSSSGYSNPNNVLADDGLAATSGYSTSTSTRSITLRFSLSNIPQTECILSLAVQVEWMVSTSLSNFSSTWRYRFGTSDSFSSSNGLSPSITTYYTTVTSPSVSVPLLRPNPNVLEVWIETSITGSSSGTFSVDYFAVVVTTGVVTTSTRSETVTLGVSGTASLKRTLPSQAVQLFSTAQTFRKVVWLRSRDESLWVLSAATVLPRSETSHVLAALETSFLSAEITRSETHHLSLGASHLSLFQDSGTLRHVLWRSEPFLSEEDDSLVRLRRALFQYLSLSQEDAEARRAVHVLQGFALLVLPCPDIKFLVEDRMPLFVGSTIPLTLLFLNQEGLPYDPAQVTFLVKPPSGDTVFPSLERLSQGRYRAVVTFSEPGTWSLQAIGQGVQGTQSSLRVVEEFLVEVQPLS